MREMSGAMCVPSVIRGEQGAGAGEQPAAESPADRRLLAATRRAAPAACVLVGSRYLAGHVARVDARALLVRLVDLGEERLAAELQHPGVLTHAVPDERVVDGAVDAGVVAEGDPVPARSHPDANGLADPHQAAPARE